MAGMNVQAGDGGVNSPRVSSPWSQIVRGGSGETDVSVTAVSPAPVSPSWSSVHEHIGNFSPDWSPSKVVQEAGSSPEDSGTEGPDGSVNSGGSNAAKKPVWNKPSNGVVEVVNPVMGAAWPALGESTKASPKSSSSESLKALSDGPLPPALQVTGNSSPTHKQASAGNTNPASTHNYIAPMRQRSMKRVSGSSIANASANGAASQLSPTGQDPVVEIPQNTSGKPGIAGADPSPRDHLQKESPRGGFGSQSHSGNDHHHQRSSYRRGNGGQHPRGDGSYHHNFGGKRDHDRGNQEWNQHSRSFNNRDTHLQPQRGFSRGYMRPSVHTPAPFIPPPMPIPVQSFGNNMMYPDVASPLIYVPGPPTPESLRTMPFVAPMPPQMYFAVPDPQLHAKIVSQIDYYFSNENLVKDTYLRKNMDEQGWVPVHLIAGFKKVQNLTDNVQLILDAMRSSVVVEVQGDKIRRRNDWMRWIMPPPQADLLVSQLQGIALEEGEFSGHLQQPGGERANASVF